MEIRIGMTNVSRELILEVDQDRAALQETINNAITKGENVLLTDTKKNTFVVAGAHIAYIEIGESTPRQVGFVR